MQHKKAHEIAHRHRRYHERAGLHCNSTKVVLAADGVAEAKSSPYDFEVYSVRFENCRKVYTVAIEKPYCEEGKTYIKENRFCAVNLVIHSLE